MNVLILINPAKNYKSFFSRLATVLKNRGHSVCFAADARRHLYQDPIPELDANEEIFHFDEYFRGGFDSTLESNYSYPCTWGEFYYSDFDRFYCQDYNLSRGGDYWVRARKLLDNFFEEIIVARKIDLVVYENISNSFEYSAYRTIERLGGKYFGLIGSRIPGMYELQSSVLAHELALIQGYRSAPMTTLEKQWFDDYRSKIDAIQPDYMKNSSLAKVGLLSHLSPQNFSKALRLLRAQMSGDHDFDYANGSPFQSIGKSIRTMLRRWINARATDEYYADADAVTKGMGVDAYYVYPMHYHPESSTSVLSPQYTNEFHNIVNIANHLPFGARLYVKDHKSAHGLEGRDFFRKISAHPAVKVISPNFNIKSLIRSSRGVITVNSTAGYEALLLGKPVYMLGHAFYEDFSNVHKLQNFSDITAAISQENEWKDVSIDFVAYRRYAYFGKLDFSHVAGLPDALFEEMAENIENKFVAA